MFVSNLPKNYIPWLTSPVGNYGIYPSTVYFLWLSRPLPLGSTFESLDQVGSHHAFLTIQDGNHGACGFIRRTSSDSDE